MGYPSAWADRDESSRGHGPRAMGLQNHGELSVRVRAVSGGPRSGGLCPPSTLSSRMRVLLSSLSQPFLLTQCSGSAVASPCDGASVALDGRVPAVCFRLGTGGTPGSPHRPGPEDFPTSGLSVPRLGQGDSCLQVWRSRNPRWSSCRRFSSTTGVPRGPGPSAFRQRPTDTAPAGSGRARRSVLRSGQPGHPAPYP
jgi:hypothetical protein